MSEDLLKLDRDIVVAEKELVSNRLLQERARTSLADIKRKVQFVIKNEKKKGELVYSNPMLRDRELRVRLNDHYEYNAIKNSMLHRKIIMEESELELSSKKRQFKIHLLEKDSRNGVVSALIKIQRAIKTLEKV